MHTNRLINETSPYLLQHAHNPVDWYPWGEEALKKAKEENKLLLISVGYSACHWCHVMERESFEDEGVAAIMNAHFVCVKVDREERPDVDQIYMEAVQMLTGRGGWPLNCFALPDGRPVWGGTYFPKNQWVEILNTLVQLLQNEPSKLNEQAKALTEGIRQPDFPIQPQLLRHLSEEAVIKRFEERYDQRFGGFGAAPKFPMPVALSLLHKLAHSSRQETVYNMLYYTLDRMASSGIYDQVGGGFARYSVDERWFAPHFEKMLYDNAQLLSVYSNAYKSSKKPLYKRIVDETFAFMQREWLTPEGAYYSALDADSEGVEGKFYIWSYEDIRALTGDDVQFLEYFNCKPKGNWEHGANILHGGITQVDYAQQQSVDADDLQNRFKQHLQILLNERNKRIKPGLDDKIITSWNALAVCGFCDAYQAFGDQRFLVAAETTMRFLMKEMRADSGQLMRTYKLGAARITGFLDDYAFTTAGLLQLYQSTFNEQWLNDAQVLTKYVLEHFYDEAAGIFYYTPINGEVLIARKTELQDNVIPSSVGTMAKNLSILSQLTHQPDYEIISEMLIAKMQDTAEKHPNYYAQWAELAIFRHQQTEIAIVGGEAKAFRGYLQQSYRPFAVYAGSISSESTVDLIKGRHVHGKTNIFQCVNKSCELPVDHPDKLK